MNKRGIALHLFILLIGICVGVIFGIGVKTMVIPNEDNFIISSAEQIFCKGTTSPLDPLITNDGKSDCRLFFVFTIVVSLFMGMLVFVGEHNRIGNWGLGMWLYILGWLIGSSFIYLFV